MLHIPTKILTKINLNKTLKSYISATDTNIKITIPENHIKLTNIFVSITALQPVNRHCYMLSPKQEAT
jgi:hypothetical protein